MANRFARRARSLSTAERVAETTEHPSAQLLRFPPARPKAAGYVAAGAFILVCSIILFARVFAFPLTPVRLFGDHMVYVEDAQRMLNGEVLYRDFSNFTLSGTQWFYFAAFKLFGLRNWVPNAMFVLIGVAEALLLTNIAKRVVNGVWVYVPAILYTTIAVVPYASPTHHALSALMVTAAILTMIARPRTESTIVMVAALCAAASWFSQVRGGLAAIAFVIFIAFIRDMRARTSNRLRHIAVFAASFTLTLAVFVGYDVYQAGLRALIDCTVVYFLKYSDKLRWNQFGVVYSWEMFPIATWRDFARFSPQLLMFVLVPVAYALGLFRTFNRMRTQGGRLLDDSTRHIFLICIVGIACSLSIARSPTPSRIAPDSGLAFLVLIWIVSQESRAWKGLTIVISCLALLYAARIDSGPKPYRLDLPGGPLAVPLRGSDYGNFDVLRKLAQLVKPGDYFLDAGYYGRHFYLHARNPAPVPVLSDSDFTRPEQVEAILANLRQHEVNVIVWRVSELEGHDDPGDHLAPLRAYIHDNYVLTSSEIGFELWQRRGQSATPQNQPSEQQNWD